jgi:8-oxo-dGTP pyrophosphatase MutT (NUDIX family)
LGKQRRIEGMSPGVPLLPKHLHMQVAALCWRRSKKGIRILLVTSRDTGRWVIPKGWPMRRRTDSEAAAREAYEEAGVRGTVSTRSIGLYLYAKVLNDGRRARLAVRVFPLEVHELLRRYPETGQRRSKWYSPERAAAKVAEPSLRALIRGFDPTPPPPPVAEEPLKA